MPCGKVEVWNMVHGERNIVKTKPQKIRPQCGGIFKMTMYNMACYL